MEILRVSRLPKKRVVEMITKQRRTYLTMLMKYLRSLPKNYSHFSMLAYFKCRDKKIYEYPKSCGAIACVLGHGIAAGIPAYKGFYHDEYNIIDWGIYSANFVPQGFVLDWMYLFSNLWENYEPHHYQAADRIEKYLELDGEITTYMLPWCAGE